MIEKILKVPFLRPGLTLIMVLAACVLGGVWLQDLRRDVFPELSAPVCPATYTVIPASATTT